MTWALTGKGSTFRAYGMANALQGDTWLIQRWTTASAIS